MRRRPPARQRRWASTRKRFTRRSTRQEMAEWIFPASSGMSAASPENDRRSMTTFQEARAFLLKDRPALWIVDAGSNKETKLSFEALSRRSNQVANFLRSGAQARRSSVAFA